MRFAALFLSVLSCTATDLEHRIDRLVESSGLALSIMVNDFSAPSGEVRGWIDKIATMLLE